MRLKRWLFYAIGVPLAVVLLYKLMYPTIWWHQKLTVEVAVGDTLHAASSVGEVRVVFEPQVLPDAHSHQVQSRGEAVVLEIPGHGPLFVLLPNMAGLAAVTFSDLLPKESAQARYATISQIKGTRDVSPKDYPLLVTFGDIADPKTVRKVDPADLAATFGPGVSLRRITLEITDEPVTEGRVEAVLPWLGPHPEPKLGPATGGTQNIPFYRTVSHGNFVRR